MQKYNCKVCGGELYWDAQKGALLCEYCDATYQVTDFEDMTLHNDVENQEISNVEKGVTEDTEDIEMVVYQCNHCGAELVTSNKTMATTCAYCGRAVSITEKSVGDFRPEKIIPFSIDKAKAISLYKEYINKSPIAPKEFTDDAVIEKMQGLYVPFWLYSLFVDGKTSFECEKVSSRRSGDYKITTHQVYNVIVDSDSQFSYVPVDASVKLDNQLMDSLDPYSLQKIVDYNPAYMAGYFAEQFDESPEKTFDRGKEKIVKAVKNLAISKINGYSSIKTNENNTIFRNEVVNYGMLPVWLLNVEYKGEKYTFAVNGDTGKAVGKIPVSQSRLLKKNLKTVGIWYIIALILSIANVFFGINPLFLLLGI